MIRYVFFQSLIRVFERESKKSSLNIVSKTFFALSFLIFFFLIPTSVSAATYYVDTSVTDTNVASATPDFTTYDHSAFTTGSGSDRVYKTIADINAGSFSGDDQILFRKGQTWRENLVVPSSGTSGHPIVFGSFGSGNKPILNGSSQVSGWTNTDIPADFGNLLDEGFEGTGYQNTWSETIGSGSVVDEDSTAVTPPTGGGSQILNIQKVSPNYNAKTRFDMGSEQSITYSRFYVYITSEGLSNSQFHYLFRTYNGSSQNVTNLRLNQNASGELRFQYDYWNNGGTSLSANYPNVALGAGSISLNTWYKIELKYDATNSSVEFRVNGSTVGSAGTLTGSLRNPPRYIDLGNDSFSYTLNAYYDRVAVDSTIYLSDSQALPANVWKASLSSTPTVTWFDEGGPVTYGTSESSLNNLSAQYEWFYTNNYLLTYSLSDPDSLYTSVEASQRNYGINGSVRSYITIDGLEIEYTGQYGVSTGVGGTNFVVQNNTVHHVGIRNGTYGEGIHIRGSTNQVLGNSIYETGNHGIYVNTNGASENIFGVTVSGNIVRNSYHSSIDIMNIVGTLGTVTVKNNLIYYDDTYDTSYVSAGIFISGDPSNVVTDVTVYNNIAYNVINNGVSVGEYTQGTKVYNNTVYNSFPGYTSWSPCFSVSGAGITSAELENNMGIGCYSAALYIADASYVSSVDYNDWYKSSGNIIQVASTTYTAAQWTTYKSNTGFDANSPTPADPSFVNASSNNFHLLRNSIAFNTGTDLSGTFTSDYAGTSRPQETTFDIGAYEYIPLTVTINQKSDQSDPTSGSSINFTVVFSESVSDFATGDVTLTGTAGATTGTVTGSGTTYNVAVTGMAGSGTVIASILADKATGSTGNTNEASTGTDSTVTYDITPPTLTSITISDTSGYTNSAIPTITIVSSNSPTHIALSCNGGTNYSSWIVYADSISSFNITNGATGCTASDGSKTITAKLKDALGNESTTANDTTSYDTTGPSTPGVPQSNPTTPTTSTTQTWTWTTATDVLSGLASYAWRTTGSLISNGTSLTNSVVTNLAEGVYSFFVKAIDSLGNEGSESQETLTVEATPSPTPLATSSPSNTNNTSNVSAPTCGNTTPSGNSPWLYEANANNQNSITLRFTNWQSPVDHFVLEYGTKSGEYKYSVDNISKDSKEYLIKSLNSNTTYYFRVRTGNGCATGAWSNEISAKTLGNISLNNLAIIESEIKTVDNQVPTPISKSSKNDTREEIKVDEAKEEAFGGYDVNIKVIDTKLKPVLGAKVTLHSDPKETTTDENGIAHFTNVEKGDHKVLIAYGSFEGEQSINLTGDVKEFNINVTVDEKRFSISLFAWLIIGGMGILIIYLVAKLRSNKNIKRII